MNAFTDSSGSRWTSRSSSLRRIVLSLLLVIGIAPPLCADSSPSNDAGGYVNFSFERVDIRMLVKIVGDMTGRRFVVDEDVGGEVSVVTPTKVPRSEIYPLFLSILESNGYSVRKEGGAYHVVPLAGEALPMAPTLTEKGGGEGIVTKVISLENISAIELAKLVAPMIRGGKKGAVSAFGPTNHLIITDTVSAIERVESIVAQLDKPGSTRSIEVVSLDYASAEEIAEQLTLALKGAGTARASVSKHLKQIAAGGEALPTDMMAIPATQANSVLLVGTSRELSKMKRIVEMLDVAPTEGGGRLHAIFLNYMSAKEGAKALTSLLEKAGGKESKSRISIEADNASNALLVDAPPHEFQWLKELVEKIDVEPRQVLVEILIVEVNANDELELGVEWTAVDNPAKGRTTVVGRSRPGGKDVLKNVLTDGVYPQGLAVGISTGLAEDGTPLIPFLLRALKSKKDFNVLSKVPLWAQDNKEASVSVVENIPILKSTIEGGAGTARDVIQNIDRMDVGIKLNFTPHVNPEDQITLNLHPSIEAILDESTGDQPFTPTIAKREVETTVTIPDGSTIVISGLIREDKVQNSYKVPLLGDVPYLGALFRYDFNKLKRTNLLIFVSPHLIEDMAEAERHKQRWEDDTGMSESASFQKSVGSKPEG